MPDLWRWGVQEMRTNPLWHQKTTREEGLRRILGMGIIGAAIVASGGAALVPIAIGAGIGGGIAYGAQVWGNYQHGLRGPAMWKHIDWWAVAQGAFHGAVSAAAAELIAPLLPSGGTGLAGVLETGISEFIGGRATQVTLNVVSGREPDADLWNLLDIALDVVPGMAVAGLREWKAARAARQLDDVIPPSRALAPYDPDIAAVQQTSWRIRVLGRTAERYQQRGMLTDQEFMALMDARVYGQVTGKWGDFGVLGSHAATPSELHSRELYTQLPQAEINDLSFRWRIMKDRKTRGPTYRDVEFWAFDEQRLPQEFFDFVYERAPTLKGKEIDWDYHKYHETPPPGIYFGSGGTYRVLAAWAQPPGQH